MPNYSLGTAKGTVELDYKGGGITKADADLKKLGVSSSEADASVGKVGTAVGAAGLLIAGGLAVAVNSAANFEQKLSGIKSVSGATTAEMEQLRSKALQLGKDTVFSASDAASAMEELAKAGLSTTDILGGAADATVSLAAASGIDLPQAALIASDSMHQFGLEAKDMPHVVDLIAGAANASSIDVSQLGFSLQQVGAVANLVGFSFKDTAIAIAEMGQAGIKGADAGTSLKTMFSRLQPTTKAAIGEMESLGLVTYDNAKATQVLTEKGIKPASKSYMDVRAALILYMEQTYGYKKGSKDAKDATDKFITSTGILKNQFYDSTGKMKSLKDVQELLRKSMVGMSSEQKQAALNTIFGSDAIRAAAILAKNGAAGYDQMAAAMSKVTAADVAKTRLDNLKGSIEQLKGSAETLAIQMGTLLVPALRSITDALTGMLNGFLSLSPGVQKFIVIAAAWVAGVLMMIGAYLKILSAIRAFQIAWVALNIAFSATPIGLIIIGIIALIAALVLAYKNSETFRDIVNAAWAVVRNAIGAVIDWFTGTAWPALKAAWDAASGAAVAVGQAIAGAWNAITGAVQAVWDAIVSAVRTAIGVLAGVVQSGMNAISSAWSSFWNGPFGGLVKAAWDLLVAIVKLGIALVNFAIQAAIAALLAVWNAAWNLFAPPVKAVLLLISSAISTAWNAITSATSSAWNALVDLVTKAIHAAQSVVSSAVSSIKSVVSAGWNAVKDLTSSVWNSVDSVIGDKVRDAISKVKGMISDIKGFFSGAASWLYNAGRDIIMGLVRGLTDFIHLLTDKLNFITNLIPKGKGPPSKDKELLVQNGVLIMTGLIAGIDSMTGRLISNLAGIGRSIPLSVTAPVSSATLAGIPTQQDRAHGATYNTTINNPLPEPAGESMNKRLQILTLMGV